MGGNAKAIDRITGEVKVVNGHEAYAEKHNVQFLPVMYLKLALKQLNARFTAATGEVLWEDETVLLDKGGAFNGTMSNFFEVPFEEFQKHKPIVGDIDVTVPIEHLESLFNFLALNEGREFGRAFTYVGQNRKVLHGSQISAIFSFQAEDENREVRSRFLQVDFEGTSYKKGYPDAFAKFAHSSPWVDVQQGLKGVAHKYLLMVLAWVTHPCKDAVILTDKSPVWPPTSVRRKTLHQPPRAMSFSVDKGLRQRLKAIRHQGRQLKLDDGYAYKELATKDSTYVTDIGEIFTQLFHLKPMQGDVERMSSFTGLLELCKLHLAPYEIREVFDQMCRYKLFGPGQALSRDSQDEDRQVKTRIIERMMQKFPFLHDAKTPVGDLMQEYYSRYKERAND